MNSRTLANLLLLISVSVSPLMGADAADLVFTIAEGKASLTDCDESAEGVLIIPSSYEGFPVTSIGNAALDHCALLSHVTIPDSITSIGERAFERCSSLVGVSVPLSVTSAGEGAFRGCFSLKAISLPNPLMTIGAGAFEDCSNLAAADLPDSLPAIPDRLFYGCRRLQDMAIPATVTSIGSHAFQSCSSLRAATIPDSATEILDGAFAYCRNLSQLTIGSSVRTIGNEAFDNCSALNGVTLLEGILSLGDRSFQSCYGLNTIVIPDSLLVIGDRAFNDCVALDEVTIGNAVASIGIEAFRNCMALEKVTLPASLGESGPAGGMGDGAFRFCRALGEVVFEGSAPFPGVDPFDAIRPGAKAFVPLEFADSYGGAGALYQGALLVCISVDSLETAYALAGLSGEDASPDADPFHRGFPNAVAYAFGLPLSGPLTEAERNRLPRIGLGPIAGDNNVAASIPSTIPHGATMIVEVSEDLGIDSLWTEVARKTGAQEWTGGSASSITEGMAVQGLVPTTVSFPPSYSEAGTGFMRWGTAISN